jgi:hypothetical protein
VGVFRRFREKELEIWHLGELVGTFKFEELNEMIMVNGEFEKMEYGKVEFGKTCLRRSRNGQWEVVRNVRNLSRR